jgi:predicted nucleic acid-binding protein
MKFALDTSVLVAALHGADPAHDLSRKILLSARPVVYSHALSETFSTLTGGRLGMRVSAADAAAILEGQLSKRLDVVVLTETDLLRSYSEASARGVRGGAIYDYLHLVAARKAGVQRLYTLNATDFQAFQRSGDPEIHEP